MHLLLLELTSSSSWSINSFISWYFGHTSLHETLTYALNILSKWISKLRCQRHKKQHKTSHGARKLSQSLRASKKLWYNERYCKSERHSWRHTFVHRNSQNKNTSTNPNLELEIKGRNKKETKFPSSCRPDWRLCVICYYQNANHQEPTNISQPFLPYNEYNLCNDYISKEPSHDDRFCINFPCHYVFGHVLLDTNPLDNVDSWKKVVRPTKKPRSAGPHKSKPKK